MNILFTCAGRRRYLLKYFKDILGDEDCIIATDMQLSAPALSLADIVKKVPHVYADDYVDVTLDICKRYQVRVLIPLNDLELPVLASNKKRFEAIGVSVIVSSSDVIDTCFDKYETARFLTSIGLNIPRTYIHYDAALQALCDKKLHFPLVLKPRWGSGSIGIEFVDNVYELEVMYAFLKKKIQKSILSNASGDEEYILIQEKIEGPEYGLDIMNDLSGNYQGVSVKQKLSMRSGETDKALIIENKEMEKIAACIARNLKHVANLDCDILERNGQYYVLDLNPRFGGGYPFSHEAGVNLPKAIIAWMKGFSPEKKWFVPRVGGMYSKCDTLVCVE